MPQMEDAQYCQIVLQPPGTFAPTKWGVCVPSTSNATALELQVAATAPAHYAPPDRRPAADCGILQDAPVWNTASIACACVLAALAALVGAGTLLAWTQRHFDRPRAGGAAAAALGCWDAARNWKVLTNAPRITGSIDFRSMNGFRVLSLWWVIMGHTGSGIFFNFDISNFSYWAFNGHNYEWMRNWYWCLYAGLFAVDTFLFIGATLVGFKASQEMDKRRRKATLTFAGEARFWALYVLNRFLRIWPVLIAVLFFGWKFAGLMVDSPFWTHFYRWVYDDRCGKYWWATLLFVQNLYPGGASFGADPKFCVGVSWYLAVDMQLYVFVAPVVLIAWNYGFYSPRLFKYRRVLGAALVGLLLAGSLAATIYIVVTHQVAWQFLGIGDYDAYYIKPWVRAPPYLLGLLLGMLLHAGTTDEGRGHVKQLRERAPQWVLIPPVLGALALLCLLVGAPGMYISQATAPFPSPLSNAEGNGLSLPEIQAYMSLRHLGEYMRPPRREERRTD